jgi:ubiquinone/menaquinone biosynthesis C-methylase UbiE
MRALRVLAAVLVLLVAGCTSWKRCSYEAVGRDAWQQPDRVIEALAIRPGDTVADLGSGSGYFTVLLAKAVGPDGRVYAVDVDEEMNDYLRERVRLAGLDNVEVVEGRFEDPLLPDGAIDLLFTSNTYHHIQDRPEYFRNVQRDLADGGRVAIVDFDGRKGIVVRLIRHYSSRDEILREMEEAGYELVDDFDFIDRQSFLVFSVAPPAAARPR